MVLGAADGLECKDIIQNYIEKINTAMNPTPRATNNAPSDNDPPRPPIHPCSYEILPTFDDAAIRDQQYSDIVKNIFYIM